MAKKNCIERVIYRFKPPVEPGLSYRFWDNTNGSHLDPLEWSGPADTNGFPLPTANPPTIQGVSDLASLTDIGVTNPNVAMRYGIIEGWIFLPEGTTHIQDVNAQTGELGMVLLGECCGGSLIEQPGGNHTENTGVTDRVLLDPTPCLLYTSPSPRDQRGSRMPSSA